MKKTVRVLSMALALTLATSNMIPVHAKAEKNYGQAKNVIVMVPDGTSTETVTLARWVDKDHTLNLDDMATGLVKTHNSNTPIADSAPAATAMATGIKSEPPYVGTAPSHGGMPGAKNFKTDIAHMPLANHIEAAERQGRSTGIVSTSNVQHATPAAFSSHHSNRKNYEALAEQQVYQGMEVVLGAGSRSLQAENRSDKEDLVQIIKDLGYDYVTDTTSFKASTSNKIWGMFDPDALANDWDRDPEKEPSLAEMTEKAIEVLSKNDKGFFLVVEGSKVDWSAHANDPVGIVSEMLAYDEAVGIAKNFALNNPDTVVISASDHSNSGITMGNASTSGTYKNEPLELFTGIISQSKLTGEGAAKLLDENKSNVAQVAKQAFGIDLTQEEIDTVVKEKNSDTAFGHIIANRSGIGFTTHGHTGGDVGLYVLATGNVTPLSGTVNNSDIGRYIQNIMGTDLDALTSELFIYSKDAFESKGATISFNYNEGNPILEVEKDNSKYQFPTYKNYALIDGEKVDIGGITILNHGKIYVPKGAVDLVK